MKENTTFLSGVETLSPKTAVNLTNVLEHIHSEALRGESYEDSAAAVRSVEVLQDFRKKTARMPFASFCELVEGATILNQLLMPREEKDRRLKDWAAVMSERSSRFSPRVADLYQALIAEAAGDSYKPHFEEIREQITILKKDGDLHVMFSPEISWPLKLNRIETRFSEYLSCLRAADKREGKEMTDDIRKWRAEELKKVPTHPPQRRNESRPGVDPMERLKEGERAPALWSIEPAWGGYYKEQSFSRWDEVHKRWMEDKYVYGDAQVVPLSANKSPQKGAIDFTISSKITAGTWVSLPVPYTHDFNQLEAGGKNYSIKKDQYGDLVVFVEGNGEAVDITVTLAPNPNKKFTSDPSKITVCKIPAEFSAETTAMLEKIRVEERDNIMQARVVRRYISQRIKYLAPKDRAEAEYYNNIYRTSPKGFAGAVDELKKGDCDVVNTYFAALCARLNIPVRHCVGHSVKGRNQEGAASINAGTGHGWSEVWDEIKNEWVRMDATPAGDPNLEEDEQRGGEAVPGDYGEQEVIRPSDEELEKLRERLAERKEQLSYTKEERQLAEAAGIDLKEAREIVKEIHEAEKATLPNTQKLVIDVLGEIFGLLIQSRKAVVHGYTGPVRESEGGEEIEDLGLHYIQMKSGEADPVSRRLPTDEAKEETLFGGFDLYLVGDKSGSMSRTMESRETLWKMQRQAEYLLFASLYQFEKNLERAGLPQQNDLSVQTQGISFRGHGSDDIDLDKPLSPEFTGKDKVRMWHSLTQQGSNNGDPEALGFIYEQIKKEIEEIEKKDGKDNRLRIVIACSDGGYVGDDAQKMQSLAEKLHELNTVVVGMGITDAAAAVPEVMHRPPFSYGGIVHDISHLPAFAAAYVVLVAVNLFPEKAKANVIQLLKNKIGKMADDKTIESLANLKIIK